MQADDLIADMMDGVRSQLPGADDPLILYTLRDCVRELCRIGRVWKIEREMPAVRNLGVLRTSTLTGFGELIWLVQVTFNGVRLAYRTVEFCRDQPRAGKPAWYAFEPPDRIYLNPILQDPAPEDRFCIHAFVQPRLGEDPGRTIANVPIHVLSRYAEPLKEGVLGKLMAMPGKPWSNTMLAGVYIRSFKAAASHARVASQSDFGANPRPQWHFHSAAARGFR